MWRARGLTGDLRWAYRLAATIGPWELAPATDACSTTALRAHVVTHDPFVVTQAPLSAWLRLGHRTVLRYPVLTLQIADGVLTATLGPREVET